MTKTGYLNFHIDNIAFILRIVLKSPDYQLSKTGLRILKMVNEMIIKNTLEKKLFVVVFEQNCCFGCNIEQKSEKLAEDDPDVQI